MTGAFLGSGSASSKAVCASYFGGSGKLDGKGCSASSRIFRSVLKLHALPVCAAGTLNRFPHAIRVVDANTARAYLKLFCAVRFEIVQRIGHRLLLQENGDSLISGNAAKGLLSMISLSSSSGYKQSIGCYCR